MKKSPRYIWFVLFSAAVLASAAACKSSQNPANLTAQAQDQNPSQDPADANEAPADNAAAQTASYDASTPYASAPQPGSAAPYPAQPGTYDSGQYAQDQ